jgi:general secretion pathway protein B
MSYILDALKKAERERDIRQVPTLMAEHESGAKYRKLPWVVLGALVLCVSAVIWLTLFLQRTMNPMAPSPTTGEYGRGADEVETTQPGETTSSAMPAAKTESASEKSTGPSPAAPRAIVPVFPHDFPAATAIDRTRLQQMAESMAAAARQAEEGTEGIPSVEMTERQPPRIPAPSRATKAEASVGKESKPKPESLKEALNEMTLSVLVFDENKADRMVFINGRKYVEGDFVEDTYLLESITLEGAVLTFRGERVLLRPKAR